MSTSYLASTVVTGAALLLVVFAAGRANARGSYRPVSADAAAARRAESRDGVSRREWGTGSVGALLFAVVAVPVGGLFVTGATGGLQSDGWMAAGGLLGIVIVGYLAWGVHHAVRCRGRPNAAAVAVSAWVLGLLFVAAVAARLVLL